MWLPSFVTCSSASATEHSTVCGVWKLDQVAYVVRDMGASLPAYQALFGPFEVAEYPLEAVRCRGRDIDCRLKVATNNDGPIEIEIIEVMEGHTPHSEHIESHGEGLHHVRFRVDDIDGRIAKMESEGYEAIFYKRISPEVAFVYMEAQGQGGRVIELLEMPA